MSCVGLHWRTLRFVAIGALLVGSACSGGGDGGSTTGPGGSSGGGTPAISISLSSATSDLQASGTSSVTVSLTRSGGFTGDVALSVDGLPTGVTVSGTTISSSATSTTLTFSANASVATGTGVTGATAPLSLSVHAATSTAGGFSLTPSPAAVSLAQGATSTVTINIARTGSFTGAVGLTVSGAPTGLTATLSSASVTGNSATLTLVAASTLAAGTQTLSIKGTGTGASDQTISLPITITAASGGSTGNVTWKFCGTFGLPIWVAAQDGTGAWQRVTGANDTYSFNITTRGGVAYVLPTSTGFDLEVFYGTVDELQGRGGQICNGAVGAGKTVTASVTGAGATDLLLGALGPSSGSFNNGTSVTFSNVPNGTLDLIATKSTLAISGTGASFALNKMLIRRGLSPAAGSALSAIDFGGSEAFDPVTRNLTIGNIGGDIGLLAGLYFTSNNTFAPYLIDATGTTGGTRTYKGVPSTNQAAGDLHILTISAVPSLTQATQTRNITVVFKDAIDRTVTLGPSLNAPTISTLSGGGYGRARAAITVQPEYNKYFTFDVQQPTGASRRTYIQQTAAYASGSTLNLDIPDFSGVSGFDVSWGLKVGTSATWTITSSGWTTTGGVVAAPYVDGASYSAATRQGSVTP